MASTPTYSAGATSTPPAANVPNMPCVPKGRWGPLAYTILFVLFAAMFPAVWLLKPNYAWAAVLLLQILLLHTIGVTTGGRFLSSLIDELNLVSLQRAQALMWTVLVFSGYFAMVMLRIIHLVDDPLNVKIDTNLWALLGISYGALVATPYILTNKRSRDPDQASVVQAAAALNQSPDQINADRRGTVYANPCPQDARFSDMFEGDEIGNTAYIDLSKLQMFLATVVVGSLFAADLWQNFRFSAPSALDHLPNLPTGMVAVLAISHLGNIGMKTIDHTPSGPAGQ